MKLQNFRSNIFALIAEKEKEPFQYGINDCSTFGADIVKAVTGHDPAEKWRGKYKTELGGLRAIKKDGYDNQIDFLEKNFDEIPPVFAQFGDIGLTDITTTGNPAIVLLCGVNCYGITETGLARFDFREIKRAFKTSSFNGIEVKIDEEN